MLAWFKKYFVPHAENDHQPHILRKDVMGFFLWVIFLSELVYLAPIVGGLMKSDFFAAILPPVLVDDTNYERTADGLNTLRINPLLEEAARRKAQDMAAGGYFAHTSPAGTTPWHWLDTVGYTYLNAGENLAVNFSESQDIHTAWMNSPGHRANILSDHYTEIGIGTAKGIYKGQDTIFVVQFFGKPANKKSALYLPTLAPNPSTPAPLPSSVAAPVVAGATDDTHFVEITHDNSPDAPATHANPIEQLLSNPRALLTDAFGLIFAIMALALLLTIGTHYEHQHHPSITNGLVVVACLLAILLYNQGMAVVTASIY